MRSHSTWSITICRWAGLHVRVHGFMLLFACFTLFLGWTASQDSETPEALSISLVSLAILFGSVVLHELGHYWAALRLGGNADEIVLGPLGGLSPMRAPAEPRSECLMHLAGPMANFVVCVVCGLTLVGAGEDLRQLLHPLAPQNLIEGASFLIGLKLAFWINWLLLIVNLIPAFPFDGGRALRAALSGIWPDASPRRAATLVALLAKCASVIVVVIAVFLLVRPPEVKTLVPIWFALLLLAIFLYFSAKQEEERLEETDFEEGLFGYDFSQGYTSLEQSVPKPAPHREPGGFLRRWFDDWRQARLRRQLEIEADEEQRVDEILARLHKQGMEALTAEERALLARVSQRYRQRHSG